MGPHLGERGQALFLLVAALLVLLVCAVVAGAIGKGFGARADAQRAADLAALSGARAACARSMTASSSLR